MLKSIEAEGKIITNVTLNGGDMLNADHYVLDYDPVTLFKQYLNNYSILPAFKNRIIPKQNVKECIRARVFLNKAPVTTSQIIAETNQTILSARNDMKKDGGAQKPILSVVNTEMNSLDVIAQYFDPRR